MKRSIIVLLLAVMAFCGFANIAKADTIPDILETVSTGENLNYPVRDNALVIVLQPFPDNSGDYTMTVCNKNAHCVQTSMLPTEIRYIGLFLEDIGPAIKATIKSSPTKEQWDKRQDKFRSMYADYMNMYDKLYGALKTVKPPEINYEVTGVEE